MHSEPHLRRCEVCGADLPEDAHGNVRYCRSRSLCRRLAAAEVKGRWYHRNCEGVLARRRQRHQEVTARG